MLSNLKEQPADKILQLMQLYKDDTRSPKLDLGVGVYKDATGLTPVMKAVKRADKEKKKAPSKKKAAKAKAAAKSQESSSDDDADAIDLMLEILENLSQDYDAVWGSMIKQAMRRVHPDFNEVSAGYRNFTELLQDAEKEGCVKLEYDERRGNYRVDLVAD